VSRCRPDYETGYGRQVAGGRGVAQRAGPWPFTCQAAAHGAQWTAPAAGGTQTQFRRLVNRLAVEVPTSEGGCNA